MSYFGTAWTTNYSLSVRRNDDGALVGGFIDTGNLGGATDSTPAHLGETENYLFAMAGYVPPFTGPITAGARRGLPPPGTPTPGRGCKAFFYVDGFTPHPTDLYDVGTSVPGWRSVRMNCWLTLPDDRLAAFDTVGGRLLSGTPTTATQSSLPTSADYSPLFNIAAMGLLVDGRIVLAASAAGGVIVVSEPLDPTALPTSYDASAHAFTWDGIHRQHAGSAAICAVHGAALRKVQFARVPEDEDRFVGGLVDNVTADSARLIDVAAGASPAIDLLSGVLSYSVAGGALTYAASLGVVVIDGDQTIQAFVPGPGVPEWVDPSVETARSIYADSHAWAAPAVPPFWTRAVRCVEIP